ncbi:SpdA protein [Streptomyces indonesiensis]
MSEPLPELDGTSDGTGTVRAVTGMMAAVVSLTFLFGFGNVWNLALRLGVPAWVAPLVAPAVDLSILGLLLGIRYLALHGAPVEQLRPARRLLVLSSGMTLALNTADPLIAGDLGKAAFDAVGPVLLIGWAEVGPGLLHALATTSQPCPAPHPSAAPQYEQASAQAAAPRTMTEPPAPLPRLRQGRNDIVMVMSCWSAPGRKTPDTGRPTNGRSPRKHSASGSTSARHAHACW